MLSILLETWNVNPIYIFPWFFRSQEFNETSFDEWVDAAKAPALPSSLKLYNELQGLGFHVILLTGRAEFQRNSTEANLLFAGYQSWEKLILRYSLQLLYPMTNYICSAGSWTLGVYIRTLKKLFWEVPVVWLTWEIWVIDFKVSLLGSEKISL